jgi:hypothetical protein
MHRILGAVAVTLLVSAIPAFAADQSTGQMPAGGDTSTGAKEQSSAPPGSDAAGDSSAKSAEGASGDTSTGAKEQSSAPPGSAAATGQPNASSSSGTASSSDGMKSSKP